MFVRYTGHVLPETINISVSEPLNVTWKDDDEKHMISISVTIKNSIVSVECDITHMNSNRDPNYLYLRAKSSAQTAADLFAFMDGSPVSVIIDKYHDQSGKPHIIGYTSWEAAKECKAFSSETFGKMWQIVMRDVPLFMALSDLNNALSDPHLVAVNCGRAVEALRRANAPSVDNQAKQWEKFRFDLRVSADYLKLITSNSVDARHGKRFGYDETTLVEVVNRTWVVMNRYLELKMRGIESLPENEFSVL